MPSETSDEKRVGKIKLIPQSMLGLREPLSPEVLSAPDGNRCESSQSAHAQAHTGTCCKNLRPLHMYTLAFTAPWKHTHTTTAFPPLPRGGGGQAQCQADHIQFAHSSPMTRDVSTHPINMIWKISCPSPRLSQFLCPCAPSLRSTRAGN